MANRDIVVIGGSAGGIEACSRILEALPAGLPASIFLVVHVSPGGPGMLAEILARRSSLPVVTARHGEAIRRGTVYVARPDLHLLIEEGTVQNVRGPRENRHRPALDPLFRSAAVWYGPRVIGVVLSGNLDDGTAGLRAIKDEGGYAIVQDPLDAVFPGMPSSAIANVEVDEVLPVGQIAARLRDLVTARIPPRDREASPRLSWEVKMSRADEDAIAVSEQYGKPSVFTCPDCSGTLWELDEAGVLRFRCRVGHAFTVETMASAQTDEVESALWTALMTLEENAGLSRRLAEREKKQGREWLASRFAQRAAEATERAEAIRRVLVTTSPEDDGEGLEEAQA